MSDAVSKAGTEATLDRFKVCDIKGEFFIPNYQRGYRWGTEEVTRLLDDICASDTDNYYLQPIVVKNLGGRYELIDGQQRLTTLYLIYQYMHIASGGFLDGPAFSLTYATREKSREFLEHIDLSRREENIDFWFICNAYEAIGSWFDAKDKKSALTNVNKYFDERIWVIWYEIGSDQDANDLFQRLNIGKIPLTSAELVKAMFLSGAAAEGGKLTLERQREISLQWDNIERELHNAALWAFLTDQTAEDYPTRIDLILDMMTGKPAGCKEKYFTFFKFDAMRKGKDREAIWRDIQNAFLILKDWFENHALYHKIGYLINTGTPLVDIYDTAKDKTKQAFAASLDDRIKKTVEVKRNYGELSYLSSQDRDRMQKLLLLFNVESVRLAGKGTQWFPFDKYKFNRGSRVIWSLEHIHAQQSEGLRTQAAWVEWLKLHLSSLKSVEAPATLIGEVEQAIDNENLDGNTFLRLHEQVTAELSEDGGVEYLHSIANMALLDTTENAALNNSTFDVKRNKIIDMDRKGYFIPYCTRLVFLKYYTPSEDNQLHFWGPADRKAYIQEINTVLAPYLPEPIVIPDEDRKEAEQDAN